MHRHRRRHIIENTVDQLHPSLIRKCVVILNRIPALIRILKEPKNAILKQYKKLLALDEVDLQFDDSAYEEIANLAMDRNTGARALRSIIEEFMLDIMYQIPRDDSIGRVIITGDYIRGKGSPIIKLRGTDD